MGTFEILFLRSLVALAILLALRPRLGAGAFATRRLGLHVARNLVHFCGQYAWVWGIAITPLAVVTAIEFTTPLWVALLAAVLLGERLSPPRWTAIASGVAGILVIAHPGTSAFGRGALIVLAGAFCFAAAVLVVKTLLRTDRVTAIVFHMSLIQLPLGLAGTLFAWTWPAPSDVPWILAMGVTSLTAHYSMGRALSLGDASFVLPIDFLRLPFIALVALLLYGERVDGWTMLGAVLIFAGNFWSVRAETRAAAPPRLGVPSSTGR
jgi:drug/metabolite transporter (DMT)-like permease